MITMSETANEVRRGTVFSKCLLQTRFCLQLLLKTVSFHHSSSQIVNLAGTHEMMAQ